MKQRISLVKEDRIWDLRTQGYDYDSIARIVNVHPGLTDVIRRIRRRPPIEQDPIKRGRKIGWMSDAQIEEIKRRRSNGETLLTIAKSFDVSESCICDICKGRTYREPESKGYSFDFSNRLRR